jgi:DNA polymerase-3 subunit beta
MKFFIKKDDLNYAIQSVLRAISPKSPLPILSGIVFQCSDGSLKLSATDMEFSIHTTVQANVVESGSMVIPARYISEFAKRLPDIEIEFEAVTGSGNLATIRYGLSELNINGYSAADYPSFQVPEGEFSFSMRSEEFKNIVRKVSYALSTDDARPVFTGALLEIEGPAAVIVATDTFRLAMKKFRTEVIPPDIINVIVPGKTLNEAVRATGSTDKVSVSLSLNHITFKSGNTVIKSRLIPGKFPSYRQVIPESFSCIVSAPLREVLEAAERASLLAGERNPLIMFQTRKDEVVISVNSESGWMRENIPAAVEGENLNMLFNVRFLCDALRSCDGEEIMLKMTGTYSPALLTAPDDPGCISILVPARISKE